MDLEKASVLLGVMLLTLAPSLTPGPEAERIVGMGDVNVIIWGLT